jgi:predicted RecB family nuclease
MDIQALVNQIFGEACGNRRPSSSRHLKPSLVYRLLKDEWGVHQDYHGPRQEKRDETTAYERLRMDAGVQWEEEAVRTRFPGALRIPGWGPEDLRATIRAMCEGVPVIAHGQFAWLDDDVYGQCDVMVKCQAPSRLGDHSYRVLELKRSRRVAPYHALQAGLYNLMLGKVQGRMPTDFDVVLPEGDERVLFESVEGQLVKLLARWRDIRDGKIRPDLPGYDCALSPWRYYANRLLTERQDVTLIAGFTAAVRQKLKESFGTICIADLAKLRIEDFQAAFGPDSGSRLFWQSRAYLEKRPVLLPGASIRVPRRRRRIFFDFETSDSVHFKEPPHAYLAGTLENGVYYPFLARGAENEQAMFEELLNFIGDPEDVTLYTWTDYERGVLTEAATRHPSIADGLHRLADACVDLYAITKAALLLPVSSYSIKAVAPALAGFSWRQGKDMDGLSSMVSYWQWLVHPSAEKIEPILRYNEDDVRALHAVDLALSRLIT